MGGSRGFEVAGKGRRGEDGRSRSVLSRAMMRDMSDDQPVSKRFHFGHSVVSVRLVGGRWRRWRWRVLAGR